MATTAPCPLAFLSAGMVASFMNEILALAARRGLALRKPRLVLDNCYTMTGSMRDRTTVGRAENIALKVEIACALDDAALHQFLVEAIHASPLGGLMRAPVESLFKLARNGRDLPTAGATELCRFVSMLKLDRPRYRIVEDTHLSRCNRQRGVPGLLCAPARRSGNPAGRGTSKTA